jgi:hypothetical protein
MAAQPQPAPAGRYPPGSWTLARLLMLAACVFFALAALITAFGWDIGPAWAWAFGGFSAACLSWMNP